MALRQEIIEVLKDQFTKQISFSFGSVDVAKTDYMDVATALKDKSIGVSTNDKLGKYSCRYQHKPKNKFIMGFKKVSGDESRRALIVHEATHACFDLKKTDLKVKDSEAGGYIAQALYFYYVYQSVKDDFEEPTFEESEILTAAYKIAKAIGEGDAIEADDLKTLHTKIGEHPHYHGRLELDETYDG